MNSISEAVGRQFGQRRRTRHFPKCATCGSLGHLAGKHCPADRVNREQEQLTQEAQSLGLTAEVQMKVDEVRRAWRQRNVLSMPSAQSQVDLLRTAWGCQ